jgi:hypothetical protein
MSFFFKRKLQTSNYYKIYKKFQKLRQEFEKESYEKDKPRLLLSAAVGAAKERIDEGYEVDEICK